MIQSILLQFLFFICWGSFLNVLAYRITFDKAFFTKRSACPACGKIIYWYDNIPLLSWFLLRGQCRFCHAQISWLYPFIELMSGIILTALFFVKGLTPSFFGYFIFFSALLVATRTDLEAMVIPQFFSLWLVPVGFLFSYLDLIEIFPLESLLGACFGYGLLWVVAKTFKYATKKEGLGEGDMELLAMIGSFLGPIGVWFSLMIGSSVGLLLGGGYLLIAKKDRYTRIPFGPFLALGAIIYLLLNPALFMFNIS